MIKAENITKKYGATKVLNDISFNIQKGECVCIIGRNGCGKSTLLNIVAGITRADSGSVSVSEKIGYAPQDDILFADLSVSDNLKFWAAASGNKVDKTVTQNLGLSEFLRKRVKTLSGGMRRRVSVAISVLANPEVLILDEPFAGLDIFYKKELSAYIRQLNESGKTIIYTSHSYDEIEGTAGRLLLIKNGGIAADCGTENMDINRIMNMGSSDDGGIFKQTR
ncbi:hypothetical protein AGMMS49975_00580 [Clostridia bacterium]|nr:hypothetical protein AGMMS49975_00580 [Clostridia bacterium]